jgi:shikimate dehydrogenase
MPDRLLLGLVGHPVGHSLSPRLHNAALEYCDIEGEYKLFDIEASALEQTIRTLIKNGLKGFNVTIPHKKAIFHLSDELKPEAELIGAVNTVWVDGNGRLIGHNTDALGLKLAIESAVQRDFHGGKAILFGYGGSAQAAVITLIQLGFAEIKVLGRDQSKAETFVEQARKRLQDYSSSTKIACSEIPRNAHSSVNIHPYADPDNCQFDMALSTIPLGSGSVLPDWMEKIISGLPLGCACVDLLYYKDRSATPFLKLAGSLGLSRQDGIEMLIQQARAAFTIWTGTTVPTEVMKAALN